MLVAHDHIAYRYEVLKVIGKGSFGQVRTEFLIHSFIMTYRLLLDCYMNETYSMKLDSLLFELVLTKFCTGKMLL